MLPFLKCFNGSISLTFCLCFLQRGQNTDSGSITREASFEGISRSVWLLTRPVNSLAFSLCDVCANVHTLVSAPPVKRLDTFSFQVSHCRFSVKPSKLFMNILKFLK